MKLYAVTDKYIDYLRKFDDKVYAIKKKIVKIKTTNNFYDTMMT